MREMSRKPFVLQTILAVASCKFVRGLLRRTGKGGGTALPGKVAMKFEKDILAQTSRGMEIIVVTGTNGKTTTSNMLEHALTAAGKDVLANKSGANLLSGVTAEITCSADWLGRPKKKTAVIECDEGALKQVVPLIHPKVIIVTNLFRDQLDRYGEVMHTLEAIRTGIKKVPDSILCLNADCSLTSSLAFDVPNRIVYYGLNTPLGEQDDQAVSDARHCIRCGTVYQYRYHTYAHLGAFRCPKCGYERKDPDVAVTAVDSITARGSIVKLAIDGKPWPQEVKIGLPAVYNIYNAAAAIAAYRAFGGSTEDVLRSLADVNSSFGRMETFMPGKQAVQMILVKNPAGCSQSIDYLTRLEEDFRLVICLNDRTADGHDISWIWDADYEKLASDAHVTRILVSGDRAEDMMVRLKYAGIPEEKIALERSNENLLAMMKESPLPVFVLPNYTSMLALRKVLSDATGRKEFWEKQG
jgi:UDP-N-acetylmuramyl tripeptide synthase